MESRPVRLQLSRKNGFNLQQLSKSINGLPAVVVSRPGKWGNPYVVEDSFFQAREEYRKWLEQHQPLLEKAQRELRDKNLACWCSLSLPCHTARLFNMKAGR